MPAPPSALHAAFTPLTRVLPRWLTDRIRRITIAVITPVLFSHRTGHFRSSLRKAAMSKSGEPLPWYTYQSIEFLHHRPYADKVVLEFGGGQSTLWWAKRARHVVTFEGDREWHALLAARVPENVDLHRIDADNGAACVRAVESILQSKPCQTFDVVVIDGLYRTELVEVARRVVANTGIIICDNAEGYGFQEAFARSGLMRVDFVGNAPGVMLPHATSVFFGPGSFAFSPDLPIVP